MNKQKDEPRCTSNDRDDDASEGIIVSGLRLQQPPSQEANINKADVEEKSADVFSTKIPPNAFDPKSIDSLIASQMAKLSVDDREKVYMDVHGISENQITETPELIVQSLYNLQREIELLPDKEAYNMAEKLGSEYVHDRDFRLAFLRCEKFDCPKAAIRIIRHFQMKLYLFGEDKLGMEITQDDLDPDDMDALYSGSGRFLDAFDRGGRIINLVVILPKIFKTEAILRKGFYNAVVACRDFEVQRHGVVSIALHPALGRKNTSADNPDLNWKFPKLHEGSPFRLSAVHLCYTSEKWNEHDALTKTALSKSLRVRHEYIMVRSHISARSNMFRCRFVVDLWLVISKGTVLECLEQLRGHGIDPSCIPVNEKTEITDLFESRLRLQEQRKEERLKYPTRSTIGVPFCEDVLLGKGTPFQRHPGNQKFRRMVADRYKEYEKAIKGAKRNIAQEIVDTIRQGGGLFLKKDGSQWVPVDDAVAIVKVSANFRTLRLKGGID